MLLNGLRKSAAYSGQRSLTVASGNELMTMTGVVLFSDFIASSRRSVAPSITGILKSVMIKAQALFILGILGVRAAIVEHWVASRVLMPH
jgi:hypothetical protein